MIINIFILIILVFTVSYNIIKCKNKNTTLNEILLENDKNIIMIKTASFMIIIGSLTFHKEIQLSNSDLIKLVAIIWTIDIITKKIVFKIAKEKIPKNISAFLHGEEFEYKPENKEFLTVIVPMLKIQINKIHKEKIGEYTIRTELNNRKIIVGILSDSDKTIKPSKNNSEANHQEFKKILTKLRYSYGNYSKKIVPVLVSTHNFYE